MRLTLFLFVKVEDIKTRQKYLKSREKSILPLKNEKKSRYLHPENKRENKIGLKNRFSNIINN